MKFLFLFVHDWFQLLCKFNGPTDHRSPFGSRYRTNQENDWLYMETRILSLVKVSFHIAPTSSLQSVIALPRHLNTNNFVNFWVPVIIGNQWPIVTADCHLHWTTTSTTRRIRPRMGNNFIVMSFSLSLHGPNINLSLWSQAIVYTKSSDRQWYLFVLAMILNCGNCGCWRQRKRQVLAISKCVLSWAG